SNVRGMTVSPRFSPDGQRVIFSFQRGGNSNLFVMDLRSKATTRLTDTQVINTAPSYSPDGTRISFESDRGGKQQIYVMAANGGRKRRPLGFRRSHFRVVRPQPSAAFGTFMSRRGPVSVITVRPNSSQPIRARVHEASMIFSRSVDTDIRLDYFIFSPACR